MTIDGVQVNENRLWQTLGQLQTGVGNLEKGQGEIKAEVAAIKTTCHEKHHKLDERIAEMENKPQKTVKEISLDAQGLKLKGYPLDEIIRKAIWLGVLYLVLESVGIVPDNAIQKLIKKKPVIAAEVQPSGHSL